MAPAKAAHLARQADDGLLTLEELDRMAAEAAATTAGALQIVFGPVSAEEILLQFAAQRSHDTDLKAKSAVPETSALIQSELGLEIPATEDCPVIRAALVRHMLISDLLIGIPEEDRPEALSGITVPQTPSHRDMIARVCRQWRNRTDLKAAYAEAAEQIESDLGLARMTWSIGAMKDTDTFLFVEQLLLNCALELFIRGQGTAAAEWATHRGSRFWASERPVWRLAWRVVESAGHDLRRTAICNWLRQGMKEYEVMRLAGHSSFATTHRYYLAVADDLMNRARAAVAQGLCGNLLQNCCSEFADTPASEMRQT